MLLMLNLRDFALIDSLTLDFYPGLNVLTGETGAGKSVIIGAIGLILGERASTEHIRAGSEQAFLEAVFSLADAPSQLKTIMEQHGIPVEEEIIISREISISGRNICRVNGRTVPLTTLKELGNYLIDLHGQHSHQSLLKTERHLFLLDEFGDLELIQTKQELQKLYDRRQKVAEKLNYLGASADERLRQLELLRFQRDEIMSASVSAAEEQELSKRLSLLDNREKLLQVLNKAYNDIYGGESSSISCLDTINNIQAELSSFSDLDSQIAYFVDSLEQINVSLNELGHDLFGYLENLEVFPQEREEIESRLELYRRLKNKYGATVEELLSFASRCKQELEALEENENKALQLENELQAVKEELHNVSEHLTSMRKNVAHLLEKEVQSIIEELGMEKGRFHVNISSQNSIQRSGKEKVEFLFSANPGEPLKSLAKIISAGEMSRVMLSLKCILAKQDNIQTLIFDEIDSGIGGRTIQKVSEKMASLGNNHQVICVTHSPHIASAAHHQFYIYKEFRGERTVTFVEKISGEERLSEIARLLDGESTSTITRKHAQELLQKAKYMADNQEH